MRSELDAELREEEIRVKKAEAEDRKTQQNSVILQQELVTQSFAQQLYIPTKTTS